MIRHAQQVALSDPAGTPAAPAPAEPASDEHIAPAPRVSMQAFCESVETAAAVQAASNSATQMRLEVAGPLVVDVATCRAQRIAFIGPIGLSESRGSYSTASQMIGTGRLQMSVASIFRDAAN